MKIRFRKMLLLTGFISFATTATVITTLSLTSCWHKSVTLSITKDLPKKWTLENVKQYTNEYFENVKEKDTAFRIKETENLINQLNEQNTVAYDGFENIATYKKNKPNTDNKQNTNNAAQTQSISEPVGESSATTLPTNSGDEQSTSTPAPTQNTANEQGTSTNPPNPPVAPPTQNTANEQGTSTNPPVAPPTQNTTNEQNSGNPTTPPPSNENTNEQNNANKSNTSQPTSSALEYVWALNDGKTLLDVHNFFAKRLNNSSAFPSLIEFNEEIDKKFSTATELEKNHWKIKYMLVMYPRVAIQFFYTKLMMLTSIFSNQEVQENVEKIGNIFLIIRKNAEVIFSNDIENATTSWHSEFLKETYQKFNQHCKELTVKFFNPSIENIHANDKDFNVYIEDKTGYVPFTIFSDVKPTPAPRGNDNTGGGSNNQEQGPSISTTQTQGTGNLHAFHGDITAIQ